MFYRKSLLLLMTAAIALLYFMAGPSQSAQVQAGPMAEPIACSSNCKSYLPLVVKPESVRISNIEFTQAVQSLNNDVPLVANRPTLARITFDNAAGGPIGGITVQLRAFRNGVELGSSPISNGAPFTAPTSPNRGNINDTLNIWLPADWISAPVSVYATVGAGSRYPSGGYLALNFSGVPPMTIVLVPLQTTIGGAVRTPSLPTSGISSMMYQTYPIAQAPNMVVHSLVNGGSYATAMDMWNNILDVVTNIHNAEDPTTPNKIYYGVVNVDCSGGCVSGIGWIGSPSYPKRYLSAVGFDGAGFSGNPAGKTAIHEIGHNTSRQHAYCGASGNYYPPNTSGNLDDWGFNIVTGALYNPAATYDFMSYCGNIWTSKWGYQTTMNFRNAAAADVQPAAAMQNNQETLSLSGWLNGTQVKVSAPFALSAPLTRDDPQGEYRLDLLDAAGGVLHSQRFNTIDTDRAVKGFHLTIPNEPRAHRLALYHGSRLIFEQQAASSPRVAINTTQLAQTNPSEVHWTASDARSYLVRASKDGGRTWQVLGTNLSEQQLKLDLASMPGGDLLLEVQASDGVHVARHQTQTHVSGHKPQAQIAHKDYKDLKADQPLNLLAIAHDAEDGALTGASVRWSSDRDGALGTGTSLWLARGLSAGTHTITVTATDADGNSTSDQMVVSVQ